jgi:hypothetical protein
VRFVFLPVGEDPVEATARLVMELEAAPATAAAAAAATAGGGLAAAGGGAGGGPGRAAGPGEGVFAEWEEELVGAGAIRRVLESVPGLLRGEGPGPEGWEEGAGGGAGPGEGLGSQGSQSHSTAGGGGAGDGRRAALDPNLEGVGRRGLGGLGGGAAGGARRFHQDGRREGLAEARAAALSELPLAEVVQLGAGALQRVGGLAPGAARAVAAFLNGGA